MTVDHEAPLFSAAQVAKIFGIDIRTLWNWEEDEVLVPATRIRRRRYYALADIERLIDRKPR